jgi:outer membrane lipoprotein-sorting protein
MSPRGQFVQGKRRSMVVSRLRGCAVAAAIALVAAGGWAAAASGGGGTPAADAAEDPALRDLLVGFDRVQAGIRTLSANFSETTTSQLLKDPIQSKGRFYLTKPSSVLWEYAEPEVMRFAIANDEYVGYFPRQNRAERSDVHRWSERIFRIFGVGQTSSELGKFYEIRLAPAAREDRGSRVLLLEPKKRRVRKHVEQVRLRVNTSTFLPSSIELSGKSGYVRVIEFSDLKVNPDLSAGLYNIEIPAGVSVTNGTSGLETARPESASRPR